MAETFEVRAARYRRQFLNQLDSVDWSVLGDYVNHLTPLQVACPRGHEQYIIPRKWQGTCLTCNPLRGVNRRTSDGRLTF
jgi:hypothetical protein